MVARNRVWDSPVEAEDRMALNCKWEEWEELAGRSLAGGQEQVEGRRQTCHQAKIVARSVGDVKDAKRRLRTLEGQQWLYWLGFSTLRSCNNSIRSGTDSLVAWGLSAGTVARASTTLASVSAGAELRWLV